MRAPATATLPYDEETRSVVAVYSLFGVTLLIEGSVVSDGGTSYSSTELDSTVLTPRQGMPCNVLAKVLFESHHRLPSKCM